MAKFSTPGDVIRQIATEFGISALRDPRRTLALFLDFAPTMRKEQELLRVFLECDGATRILAAIQGSESEKRACMEKLARDIQDARWLTEDAAKYICAEFYRGVTNQKWTYDTARNSGQTGSLDVYRNVTITRAERKTGKTVQVKVNGKPVRVSLPGQVANGQTLRVPGKGLQDSATGRCGDLYITVSVQSAPAGILWKILAAVLAIVLIVLLLPKADKNNPDPGLDKSHQNSGQTVQNSDQAEDNSGQATENSDQTEDNSGQATENSDQTEDNSGQATENSDQTVPIPVETHTHSWVDASCVAPKTCATCGETTGGVAEHQWKEATYQLPETCAVCGTTRGYSLSQPWKKSPISTDTGIISVSPGGWSTYALTKEGRVYAIGRNQDGQINVGGLRNVKSISAGDRHIAVLHFDGTVTAIGLEEDGQCEVYTWKNIISVVAGAHCTVGICEDGTVMLAGQSNKTTFRVSDWKNIVEADCSDHFILGLSTDGKVRATGDMSLKACDVSGWTDIIAIAAGGDHSAGLRSDGTVVAVGNEESGACDVSDWTGIVSICAGYGFTVGLRENGTVVVAGDFSDKDVISKMKGNIHSPENWSNIVQISCIYNQIFGLTADGYIVACGFNSWGQCNVDDLHRQIFN